MLVLSALFVAASHVFNRRERRQLEQRLELVELAMKVSSSTIWEYVLRDGSVAKSQAFSPRLMTWATGYDQTPVLDWETNLSRGLIDPEDRSRLTRAIQSCVDGETPDFRVEVRTRQHDGQIRWRLVRGVVSRDPDGAPTSFVGVGTDITELKQAEGDLKHAESEMRRATEQLALATQLSKVYIWSFELLDGQIGKAPATFVNVWESLGYDVRIAGSA